ncbi:MAG: DUF1810 domain-containing protein [Calditrichaeota bacterium]|nr:MAG: DUF1810 domain-containing protein [Calditrichota bacterium]
MSERDEFQLSRFVEAQEDIYDRALAEIHGGKKNSHWMWFIFPQIAGLGRSGMAAYYAIHSRAEAAAYLHHPILGARLLNCCAALMEVEGKSALQIFGSPDDLKLRSCMTLFSIVADKDSLFERVLKKYYRGKSDFRTLNLLGVHGKQQE